MTRPQTIQDMFDALRRDRLVEPARLAAFADRHAPAGAPAGAPAALARLVAEGLLTAFQAEEVAAGNGRSLWLGNYRVLDRLGRGGMAHVFLAEHAVLGKRVAVKVLSDALRADPGARRRFVREARAAAALDHPNIVTVSDVDMAHDPPFLVMEYVDGLSLQEAVARGGAFAAGEAASVAVQVADGLARAASVGLVHRDIKPANLLIDRRGAVKILDLGIVRFTHDDTHSRIHGADLILGTLDYLAPEQAMNCSEVDTRADLYALGCTLYFLLTGHPPYPGTDVAWKMRAKLTTDPHPLQQLRPDVPPEFAAVVHRLMARDPADRHPTPVAVVAALRPWVAPGPEFPARLFRPVSDSTVHDRRATDPDPPRDPLPDTLRIIKPGVRPAAPARTPPPVPAIDDTASVSLGELTARTPAPAPALVPVPLDEGTAPGFASPLPPVAPGPQEPVVSPPRPRRVVRPLSHVVGLVVALAAVAAGIVALAALAGR